MNFIKLSKTIAKWTTEISRICAIVSMGVIVIYVSYSVIARWMFSVSVRNVIEISAYMFIAVTAMGLPYTLVSKSHVRIDFLFDRLPERIKPVVHFIGNLLTALYLIIMIISGMKFAIDSFQLDSRAATPLGTPLWIPELLLPVGFFLLLFQFSVNGFKEE